MSHTTAPEDDVVDTTSVPPAQAAGTSVLARLPSQAHNAKQAPKSVLETLAGNLMLFNAVSDAIFLADAATGRIIDANPAACDLAGIPRGQLIGRSHTIVHPPEERALHASLFAQCLQSPRTEAFCQLRPVTVLRADGGRLTCRVTVLILPHEGGEVVCGIFQSPATQALIESRLQDSEAYYAQVLPNSEEGVWSWNPATGEVFLSSRWKEQLGFGPLEFPDTAEACNDRLHPGDKDRVLAALGDCAAGGPSSFSLEYRLRCKDGAYRWMHGRGASTRDASGRVICLAGANSDITARKEAEQALRESEERFRLLARNTPDAVFLHDMQGRVLDANDRACELLGYHASDFQHLNVTDFEASCPPETLLAIWRDMRPGPFSFEGLARCKDGTTFPTEIQGVAFVERGRILALVAARDLTARKELEKNMAEARDAAMAASRAKTEFLASMSHEIRTPMNIILGMAELLHETAIAPSQKRYLEAIENSGRVLLGLINDILDLSQIEANKIELRPEAFNPAAIISDVCAFMGIPAEQKGLAFTVRLADDLPLVLHNDPARLRQVLMNLIWNAVKFTRDGGIEVGACRAENVDGRESVRVHVVDTGCGLPPEELERVFEPFTQADLATGRRPAGTGLGLAICKRLVERMGGEIGVQSEPGQGSIFYFTLPSVRDASPVSRRSSPEKDDAPPPARPRRLLLVEDSLSNRELVKLFLENEPYEIVVAGTGREALDLFTADSFDLILMDMELPELDGCAATEAIRCLEAATGAARTPVFMLSAHAFSEYEGKGRRAGCDGFMSKPIRKADLINVLRRALAGSGPP